MKHFFRAGSFILLASLLFILSSCFSSRRALGIEEGWELLSERKVNFVRDKDEITVNSRSQFIGLRFKIEGKDVRINDLKIYFQNGDKLEPALDDVIAANQYSKIIELGREGRTIDKIEFKYRSTGNVLSGRANVVVLGQKYNPGY